MTICLLGICYGLLCGFWKVLQWRCLLLAVWEQRPWQVPVLSLTKQGAPFRTPLAEMWLLSSCQWTMTTTNCIQSQLLAELITAVWGGRNPSTCLQGISITGWNIGCAGKQWKQALWRSFRQQCYNSEHGSILTPQLVRDQVQKRTTKGRRKEMLKASRVNILGQREKN